MDRIIGLSDELLVKILLLVPTKVVVSTSILSKRWEYLWMSLPKPGYCRRFGSEPECERLRCFLDRNLPLHRAPVIESFRLESCRSHFKPENINMWVLTAVSHCLRELDIVYEPDPAKPNILPSNLYTCKSLVILKLDGEILLDAPRMVSLPSLKTLKLQRVRFINNEQTLQRLLSNCPILEDLAVDLREFDIMGKLTVVVPSLQSVSLYIPYDHSVNGLVIETPNLKYFKLRFYSYDDHSCLIENMPNLIEAHIDVDLHSLRSFLRSSKSVKGLIGSIKSVKRLTLCSQTMLDEGFVFNQLEHLEHHRPRVMDDWNEPSTVPECMLSRLQSLSWLEYTGEPQERDIVVYILKHSLHLKTATIKSSESAVPKFEMLKELSLSSRASAACQLFFE